MSNKEFERLVENRKDWVRSSKENKFDFDSILAGLYNDPSHCPEGITHANRL